MEFWKKNLYLLVAQLNLLPPILDNALIMQFKHARQPNWSIFA